MPDESLEHLIDRMLEGDEVSRRAFIARLGAASLAVSGAATALAACGGVKGTGTSTTATAPTVHHAKTAITQLDFSNWPLYIDPAVLKSFERTHGGKVHYVQEINDPQEFFGKVREQLQRKQPIGRDLVVLTDYMAARWVRNGYVTPIDKANVPNARNLQDNLRSPKFDPTRSYTLPWQSGMSGIGYNPRRTGRELRSMSDLFDPKFKGRVSMLEDAHDSVALVMLWQGHKTEDATIDQVMQAIEKIDQERKKGQIRRFTGNDYAQDLTSGNLWAAIVYSGDVFQLQSDNPELKFVIPDEGGALWTDNMMMPAKAAHPYAAETMMNYVYDPKIAAQIAAEVNYVTPVKGTQEELRKTDPKLAASPLIFPDDATRARLHPYPNLDQAGEQKMISAFAAVTGG
jgi:spermidine/putrescine transport system substrate-binding protein